MRKKLWSLLLALILVLQAVPVQSLASVTSGTMYSGVTWELDDETGLLSFGGSGDLCYFGYGSPPWNASAVKTVRIGPGVTGIDYSCFAYCSYMTDVFVDESHAEYADVCGVLFSKDLTELIYYPRGRTAEAYEIPAGTQMIASYAFSNYDLKNVAIPDGVRTIAAYAFSQLPMELAVIPASVEELYSTSFPQSVVEFTVDQANETYCSVDGVLFGKEKTELIRYPAASDRTSYAVPDGVIRIAEYAFQSSYNLTVVEFPNSLTEIDQWAFSACSGLERLTLPGRLGTIRTSSFENCIGLKDVVLEEGIHTVETNAFYGSGAASFVLPESLTTVYDGAFQYCGEETLHLPDGLTVIPDNCFYGNRRLTDLRLPALLTIIGTSAFGECDALEQVTIPAGVTEIGSYAFKQCGKLSAVYFMGDAPVIGTSPFDTPANSAATLYYLEGTSGWTDSDAYDAGAGTWNGYPLRTWIPDIWKIEAVTPEEVTVNGHGCGMVYYRLTDYSGKVLDGKKVEYRMNGGKKQSVVTDGDGVFCVQSPELTETTSYALTFSVSGREGEVLGTTASFRVVVEPLRYTQTWTGALGATLGASIGTGVGAEIGVASMNADLWRAGISLGAAKKLLISDSHSADGRTFEMSYAYEKSGGGKLSSGIAATSPTLDLEPAFASAGVGVSEQVEVGIKIEDYDASDPDQLLQVGTFALQCALTGSNSKVAAMLLEELDTGFHNQTAFTQAVMLDSGASILMNSGESGDQASFFAAGGDLVVEYSEKTDGLTDISTRTTEYTADVEVSAFRHEAGGVEGHQIVPAYSNALLLAEHRDSQGALQSVEFREYDDGKKPVRFVSRISEAYTVFTFGGAVAEALMQSGEELNAFAQKEKGFLSATDWSEVLEQIWSGDYDNSYVHTAVSKEGSDLKLPFGLTLGIGVSVDLNGVYVEEFSWEDAGGLFRDGRSYAVWKSSVQETEALKERKALSDVLTEPVDTVLNLVGQWFSEAKGSAFENLENNRTSISGGFSQWLIRSRTTASAESTAVVSLLSDTEVPILSVGEPCVIDIFTDDTMQTEVETSALAEYPLTLTFSCQGLTEVDRALNVYWFDAERNAYILQESVQDPDQCTVSAQVKQQGEYILAADIQGPRALHCAVSDQTASAVFTMYLWDPSGISAFSFSLDGTEPLVTGENLAQYYDAQTGLFVYPFQNLTPGTHTVSIQAADPIFGLGEPVSYTFVVDDTPPEILSVVFPEMVTEEARTVEVVTTDDNGLSGVTVRLETASANWTLPLEQTEAGVWTGTLLGLEGLTAVTVTVEAVDTAGNRTETEPTALTVDLDEVRSGLRSTAELCADGTVLATVENGSASPVGCWLICAGYAEDGRMVAVTGRYVGLKALETSSCELTFEAAEDPIAEVKCFLLDLAEGCSPMTD